MKHESSTSEKQSVEGFLHFNSSCSPSQTEIKCYFNYSIVLWCLSNHISWQRQLQFKSTCKYLFFWVSIDLPWVIVIISDGWENYWKACPKTEVCSPRSLPLWMHCYGRSWYRSNCTKSSTKPVWILDLKWKACFCGRANIMYLKIMFPSCYTRACQALPSPVPSRMGHTAVASLFHLCGGVMLLALPHMPHPAR